MQSLKKNGILLMVMASFCFSIMGGLVKYSTVRLNSHEVVFFRTFLMFLFLLPWMLIHKIRIWPINAPAMFIRSASGFTALVLAFYVTTKITLADASILNNTSVVFVAIISIFYLKEKPSGFLFFFIFFALIGAAFIVKPSFNVINVPGVLGLTSGVFAAIAYISIKNLHKTEHHMTVIFHFAWFSSLLSFPLMAPHFLWPHAHEALALLGIGIIATLAQIFLTYAYKFADASIVSPYSYTNVLFCALWGFLFWGEKPDHWSLIGALMIIVSSIGIIRINRTRSPTVVEMDV
ncbi:DMT family transporter [bacterium]|nr:DMT family transporter [bacterium]